MKNKPSFFTKIGNVGIKFLSFTSSIFDRFLYQKRYSAIISLLLALLFYFSVLYSTNKVTEITDSLKMDEVQVEVILPNEDYEVSGIPKNVSAFVTGNMPDLIAFRSTSNNARAVIDLTDKQPGSYSINYSRRGIPNSLNAIFTPESAKVVIAQKQSRAFNVDIDVINKYSLDKQFIVSNVLLEQEVVEIKASQEKLDQISKVVASIDVGGKNQNFEVDAPVLVYDKNGQLMDVEVSPSTIKSTAYISSPSRQVPLVVKPLGEIAGGKAIDKIEMDQEVVTLYGPQEVLNRISQVPITINGPSLVNNATISYTLSLPEGINFMDVTTVNLTVSLEDKVTKVFENAQILLENNFNNYSISKTDQSVLVASVEVSGTKERVESLSLADIKVFIDLTSIKEGTQKVKINVSGSDSLVNYKIVEDEINVNITK